MNSLLSTDGRFSCRPVVLVAGFVMLLSILSFGSAPKIYIAQNAIGASNGSDCADAYAASFFNTAGNWGTGSTQIGPGSTVHLCGTIAVPMNAVGLTAHGAGTSGNPITILFEPGAQITSAAMQRGIQLAGNSYFVVDGNGTNASITNTANGSGLANQIDSQGITATPCNGCEFKNLTITNLYIHNSVSDTACGCGTGIFVNGSNWSIHDSSFDHGFNEIDSPYTNGDHNIQIYNNTFNHYNWGVHIGGNNTNTLDSVFLHDNHLQDSVNWDTTNDSFHHDGLFVVQNNTSASVTNVFFYNNVADGVQSTCSPNSCATAWIYFNTGMHGIYVFNNVLRGSGGYLVEGGYTGDTNYALYNNFMDCNGGGGLNLGNVSGFTFEDNVMNNCYTFIFMTNVTNPIVDHNLYTVSASVTSAFKWNNSGGATFAQYRAANPNLDANSLTAASAGADGTGKPQSGSPMIHSSTAPFANLSNLCAGALTILCTDRAGGARPTSGTANWDAGAYMFGVAIVQPLPPSGLLATVQ